MVSENVDAARSFISDLYQSVENAKAAARKSLKGHTQVADVPDQRPADWGFRSFYVGVAAIVCSISGGMLFAIPAGAIAVLLAFVARSKQESSTKPATWGLLLGGAALVISIGLILVGRVVMRTVLGS